MNTKARIKYLLDNFRISLDDWMLIFVFQRGLCAICGNKLIKANSDHDHASGELRGLLCARCNRALGRFGDRLDLLLAAVAYLQNPPARKALGRIHIGYAGRIGTKKHRKMIAKLRKQEKLVIPNSEVDVSKSSSKNRFPGWRRKLRILPQVPAGGVCSVPDGAPVTGTPDA